MYKVLLITIAAVCAYGLVWAQDYRIPVNQFKTGKIVFNNLNGQVIIDGYEGSEVIISVDGFKATPEQAIGLKPIFFGGTDNTGMGLLIEEINRIIEISSASPQCKEAMYRFLIPQNMDVKIDHKTVQAKEINMKAIKKEIEVDSKEGDINLENIKGPVVINTQSGNIRVSFTDLDQEYPTSINTISGNIDVTLPADLPANLILKSLTGDIYTNFELQIEQASHSNLVPIPYQGKAIFAKINHGGVEVVLESINGDIYLRKGK